jgi:hypothetical protein
MLIPGQKGFVVVFYCAYRPVITIVSNFSGRGKKKSGLDF